MEAEFSEKDYKWPIDLSKDGPICLALGDLIN